MLFYLSDVDHPIEFEICGNLICEDQFLHMRRKLDCFVLIFILQGCLFIRQDETNYVVSENQFVLLRPGVLHYGYKPSRGRLSYYWVHFHFTDPNLRELHNITPQDLPVQSFQFPFNPDAPLQKEHEIYLIPESGTLPKEKRSLLLFRQLLDIYKRGHYAAPYQCNYALNLFLLQFSQEMITYWSKVITPPSPNIIEEIIEWLRRHYSEPLNVQTIAQHFNYNPDYLSTLFRKHTGYSLLQYVTVTRINISKDLLLNTEDKIAEISHKCGFTDTKYYLRLFKKYVGVTPNNYRKSFRLKYVNVK